MAYQTKPGQGAIFKNEKRDSDKSPHYRGNIVTPSGEELEIALWLTEAKSGAKYFSAAVKEPRRQDAAPAQAAPQSDPRRDESDDGLPF